MTACNICGDELRDGDAVVQVAERPVHDACSDAQSGPDVRHVGRWAALGSEGQLDLTDAQRNNL